MATDMRQRVWRQALVAGMNEALINRIERGTFIFTLFDRDSQAWVNTTPIESHVTVYIPDKLYAQGHFERGKGFWLQTDGLKINSTFLRCETRDVRKFARWSLIETLGYRDNGPVTS